MSNKSFALLVLAMLLTGLVWWQAMSPAKIERLPADPLPPKDIYISTKEDTTSGMEYATFIVRTKDTTYHVRGTHATQGVPPNDAKFCIKNGADGTVVLALEPSAVISYVRQR